MLHAALVFLLLQAPLTVRVTDPWDLVIAGAAVKVGQTTLTTGPEGEVVLPPVTGDEITLEVTMEGFAVYRKTLPRWVGVMTIQLPLASVMDRVTVTATRDERLAGDAASSITVLDAETILTSPSRAIDDLLRQVPGFTLLRRTSSVAAHPTTQGVSLRGVGASGASRTLVMADGIPLNDPFGSWVYWNRVPRLSIDSIEVVRGGASDLYGSSALGGGVHLRRRVPAPNTILGEFTIGNRTQPEGSVYYSNVRGAWGYSVTAEAFRTDGYIAVSEAQRGVVDTVVASAYRTANAFVERRFGTRARVFSDFLLSTEDRKNGSPLVFNDTNFRQASLGAEIAHPRGRTEYRFYAGSEGFNSTFSAIAANRRTETLSSTQRVPLGYGGFDGHTLLAFGRSSIVTGLNFRHARGISDEVQFRVGGGVPIRNGGNQETIAAFVEHSITITPGFHASWSARWDRWRNQDIRGPESVRARISPKLALTYRVSPSFTVHASGYSAFRAPTLNELYRPFQAGNTLTLANPNLGDERLRGLDGAGEVKLFSGRLHVRLGGYWSKINGTVANLTLVTTPALITRQRANLGAARARGFEIESEIRPFREWTVTSSYLLSDSIVLRFPSTPALVGLKLPQVPRHQYSMSVQGGFWNGFRTNLQFRTSGLQFDDDRNTLRLEKYKNVDAFVSRRVTEYVDVFVAGENLTDARIQVSKTPVTSHAMPRTVRFGISLRYGG